MSGLFSQLDRLCSDWFLRSYGWTGIEIGCHVINMAQVRKLGDRWELAAVWSVEHSTPYTHENSTEAAASTESFGWLSHNELKRHGLTPAFEQLENLNSLFRGTSCAATLTDGMIEYRELELPLGVADEAHELVQSEIALELECEVNELLTDCWDLHSSDSRSGAMCFGAVSIQRSTALRFANDLFQAGFECKSLDALPCAMARSTAMVIEDTTATTLAVDIGYCQTTMTLVRDGQPLLSRCIRQLGIVTLLERIATSFDISISDAQTLLFQATNQDEVEEPTRKTNAFANPLHQKLCVYEQSFVAELERTVHFANRVTQTTMPAQILLMGPGVRISSLEKAIKNQIGLSTQSWSIDCSENLFGLQEIATYAVAAGLSALSWESN